MPKLYLILPLFLFFTNAGRANVPYQMSEAESVLPIEVKEKLILVKARVDGQSGYFLLDTGIGALTLNRSYFGKEKELLHFGKVTDVNGNRQKLESCPVGFFEWGGLRRDSFYAPMIDLAGLERILECRLLGLIGYEVFKDVELLIDYDAGQLRMRKLDALGVPLAGEIVQRPDHTLSFEMEDHFPVLQTRIGDLKMRFGWDTGASINMIDKRMRRHLPDNARRLMRIPFGGVFSDRKAPFIMVDEIFVDEQFAVLGWRMAATRMKHFKKKDINIDGLIGADLFRFGKVAINYRQQLISIWINDNIFSQRYQMTEGAGLVRKPEAEK